MATKGKPRARRRAPPPREVRGAGASPDRARGAGTPPDRAVDGAPFGPAFFHAVLPGMVRACPCGRDQVPACAVHLGDGHTLDVLEVVAVAERFVVLAVFEGAGEDGVERSPDDVGIEAVPYDLILRVAVRRAPARARLGFHVAREELVAATEAVDGAAGNRRRPRRSRGL